MGRTHRAKLRLRPYRAGDIDAFTPRVDMAAEKDAVGWAWADGPPPGRTWTLERWNGEVVGVGGLYDWSGGVMDAWSVLAEMPARDLAQALWLASRALTFAEQRDGATLLRASCRTIHAGALRCLKRLGFASDEAAVGGYLHMERRRS